jgi:hypothetical protein
MTERPIIMVVDDETDALAGRQARYAGVTCKPFALTET